MTKVPASLFYLLLIAFPVLSQPSITGKVVNAATGEPVAGSSVFISNTSVGTVSDKQGNFELTNVLAGKHDLIISSVGFETSVYSFSTEQLPLKLRVELNIKVKELENVIIEPSVEESWDKWGKTFMEYFIGSTPNALQCKLENKETIHFRYYKKSNRLVAFADEAVLLENRALGYRIRFQLESFEINFSVGSSAYTGYPFFEDMDKANRNPRKKWHRGREKAYYGSIMHFMRCLYKDSLVENGFDVRRMVRYPNLEKERVKSIRRAMPHSKAVRVNVFGGGTVNVEREDSLSNDSTAYYNRILNQKDYTEVYGKELITADSLVTATDGAYKIIFFPDYLYVTYKNELEDQEYLSFYRESRRPTFQRSYIWLVNKNAIAIDVNGSYFPPQEVFSMSYWGWNEKMSNMLPLDYEPGVGE